MVIEKPQVKLEGWKANALSKPGTTTLIQSVSIKISIYYLSLFKISEYVKED